MNFIRSPYNNFECPVIQVYKNEVVETVNLAIELNEHIIKHNLQPRDGAPTGEKGLEYSVYGAIGQKAGQKYLDITSQYVKFLKHEEISDLGSFVDVKAIDIESYSLIVRGHNLPEWAYLLVSSHRVVPNEYPMPYVVCGWYWGFEAKNRVYRRNPNRRNPAYFVERGHLRDPKELLELIDKIKIENPWAVYAKWPFK